MVSAALAFAWLAVRCGLTLYVACWVYVTFHYAGGHDARATEWTMVVRCAMTGALIALVLLSWGIPVW